LADSVRLPFSPKLTFLHFGKITILHKSLCLLHGYVVPMMVSVLENQNHKRSTRSVRRTRRHPVTLGVVTVTASAALFELRKLVRLVNPENVAAFIDPASNRFAGHVVNHRQVADPFTLGLRSPEINFQPLAVISESLAGLAAESRTFHGYVVPMIRFLAITVHGQIGFYVKLHKQFSGHWFFESRLISEVSYTGVSDRLITSFKKVSRSSVLAFFQSLRRRSSGVGTLIILATMAASRTLRNSVSRL